MEDYRFPLKPKDEVFGPNCYQDDEDFDYSEVLSYWYGESQPQTVEAVECNTIKELQDNE